MTGSFPNTVLIVDDEEVVVDLLCKVFDRAHLPWVAVSCGKDALSRLERERFGALVTDKNLPDISGMEVLRAARRLQPYCACVMITGYASTESVLEVLRLGAADYLEKPFPDVKLVVQRIKAAMAHQHAEFERNTLVEAVRSLQRNLEEKSARAFQLQTEQELLQSVLDLKIEETTETLKKRLLAAESEGRADRELDRLMAQKLEALLEYLRGVQGDEEAPPSVMRGVLREIDLRVDEALCLLRERLEPGSEKQAGETQSG